MQLDKLRAYFKISPALSLLRSPHAPYLVDFLNRQFKQAGRISIPHSELLTALVVYIEEQQESNPAEFTQKPEQYLVDWCTGDARWLRRGLEAGHAERVYQLTPDTEDVFAFLDRVLNRDLGFVGTESRLKMIIDTLQELVVGASDDPKLRLQHLRDQRDAIDEEIKQIEAGGRVSKFRAAQIRERFSTAVTLLRQLQGDFRAVEESFRDITAKVQQRQTAGEESRGKILEYALDAEELLKQEDQGVSFYEFVRLVLSPSQTERLEKIIQQVRQVPELLTQQDGLDTVRGMVTLLQSEAEKVMRTNHRLSATLRRLLDLQTRAENQRVAEVLASIRAHAAALGGTDRTAGIEMELDLTLAIESPVRRTFWSEGPRFEAVDLTGFEPDDKDRLAAFQQFAQLRHLDWGEMRGRIQRMLAIENAPTLKDLFEVHPPEGGVIELIGFLQIAAEDGHEINSQATQVIIVPAEVPGGRTLMVTVPHVTFYPKRKARHA